MKVTIYQLQNDGSQKPICTCSLEMGAVKCQGEEPFTENLINRGIYNYEKEGGTMLFPKDGEIFLKNLTHNFNSGYFNAKEE